MFTRDLSANVPLYGQEQCVWCGAASGQMIRDGYPNPADCLFYAQLDLWNTIQTHNSTAPADAGWATDPHGLTGCIQSLNNPAGVHWTEFADTRRDSVLFDILYWMNRRLYPCATLVNQGGHWLVIVGFETDVEPVAGSTPQLSKITIHDPEPHDVGTISTLTGAQWFNGLWNGAVRYAGSWLNRYVAVVEPPVQKGVVKVKLVKRTGRKLVSPREALKYASRWVAEMKLGKGTAYGLLAARDVSAFAPMLVRDEPFGKQKGKVPSYYIVPFGFKKELSERGDRLARVCVLLNAYTGALEEVTAFGKAVRYLPKEEALGVVAAAMKIAPSKMKRAAKAEIVFQPSDITHVRSWPFWRIAAAGRVLYVDQLGKLYGKLLPSIPGD